MQDSQGTAPELSQGKRTFPHGNDAGPCLLVPWTSARTVFFENLFDRLLFREPIQPWITARPAPFWPDVFVDQRLPWRKLAGSGLYHVIFIALVYVITANWVPEAQVKPHPPFDGTKLTYYNVSEYLPEIDTGSRPAPKERKGEPELAKQRIVSIPPAPDNLRQTIITPDPTKITSDIPLPNMVANTMIPAPPESAMVHTAKLVAPPSPAAIAPPPDVNAARARIEAIPSPDAIGPAADPAALRGKLNLPKVPGPEVVGPPPSPDAPHEKARLNLPEPSAVGPAMGGDVQRKLGAINMAHADIGVAAPKLPVPEQRAVMTIRSGAGSGGRGRSTGGAAVPAPSPASVAGVPAGDKTVGQLIALGVHPVAVNGPIAVPKGSRSGEFAAGPEGKSGAPGTPDIHSGSDGNGSAGIGTNGAGHGGAVGPPGISISPAPVEVPPGPVVAVSPTPPAARPQPKMLPALRSPRVSDIARNTRPGPANSLEPGGKPDEVFGTKKYYSMTLNMPSLTSAGGSCIIRFAELNEQRSAGDLTAPVAMLKVDPAYPPEAIRERVEGTVTLYAVIHKDGSVGEVRVLHGVDERLDHNAQIALSRWQFRPATKNGSAVELEAVVQIPFIAKRNGF